MLLIVGLIIVVVGLFSFIVVLVLGMNFIVSVGMFMVCSGV